MKSPPKTPDDAPEPAAESANGGTEAEKNHVSRRAKLLALRKGTWRTEEEEAARKKNLHRMKEQVRESAMAVSRLDHRVEILDLMVSKSSPDDAFLGRKELAPWKFRKSDEMKRKWDFVNNVVTMQEFLLAIREARERKDKVKDANASSKGQADPEPQGGSNGNLTTSDTSGFQSGGLSDNRTASGSISSDQRFSSEHSDKDSGGSERLLSAGEESEVKQAANDKDFGAEVDVKPVRKASYPVVGKATVYASGRRTYPKKSQPKSREREQGTTHSPDKDQNGSEVEAKTPTSNKTGHESLTQTEFVDGSKTVSNSASGRTSNSTQSKGSDQTMTNSASSRSAGVNSSTSQKKGHNLHCPKFKVRNLTKHEQARLQAKRVNSDSVIFGFGSHHRTDTCRYCGSTLCWGRRPGVKDNQQGKSHKQHQSQLFPSPEMKERVEDMTHIYKPTTDGKKKFHKLVLDRLNSLEISHGKKIIRIRD